MNSSNRYLLIEKIMNYLFFITIFFIPIEISIDLHIGKVLSPYKISLAILCLLYLYIMIRYWNYEKYNISNSVIKLINNYKFTLLFIILYFVFDLVSLLWTNDIRFALKKYITIIPMIVIFGYATLYLYKPYVTKKMRFQRTRKICLVLGIVALSMSMATWIIYFIYNRTYFILRMSLSHDYNQYILSILFGYICGVFYIFTMKKTNYSIVSFFAYSLVILPLFQISGSRRTMLIYIPLFIIYTLYLLFKLYRLKMNKKVLMSILLSILILILNFSIIKGYEIHAGKVYERLYQEALDSGLEPVSAAKNRQEGIIQDFRLEKDLKFKSDTIKSGEALSIRNTLWKIAIDEIKSFSIKELLIGKGASHQKDLYRTDKALNILSPDEVPEDISGFKHPHSMVFVELLNGGIIKLSICLGIIISILVYSINLIKKRYFAGLLLVFIYGAILLYSQLIDSIYGIPENRLTWIYFIIVIGVISYEEEDQLNFLSSN